jgi:hypothetical protein
MTTKPLLQKILKGILYTEDKNRQTMKGWEGLTFRRKTDKHSESSIQLAAHMQILKQQKQLNGRN